MFRWLKSLMTVFKNDALVMQFENMLIAEEAIKQAEPVVVAPEPVVEPVAEVVAPAVVEPVAKAVVEEVVEPVAKAPVAPVAPKRAKSTKGKFVADVKTTTETNEAWAGGKAPAKKTAKSKKK